MDDLDYNIALNVIEYLNVVDSGNLATTAQRYYYLVHEFRRLQGPEVVTVSSWDRTTFQQRPAAALVDESLGKLRQPPNLVLAFNTHTSTLDQELNRNLPPGAIVLGACAHAIQVNSDAKNIECKSNASVMYASFPDAEILSFSFDSERHGNDMEDLMAKIESQKADNFWKALIVYASGNGAGFVESFVSKIQSKLPDIAIVGGICSQGYVTTDATRTTVDRESLGRMTIRQLRRLQRDLGGPSDFSAVEKSELVDHVFSLQQSNPHELLHAEDSVFGVFLGGDVPVRSVVSRGVKSVTHGTPQPYSPYVVKRVSLTRPNDPDFLFRGTDLQPIHMIHEVVNRETGATLLASNLLDGVAQMAEFIGVKRANEDGFELHMLSPYSQATQSFLIMTDGSEAQEQSLDEAEIDFFVLDGEACCQDMDNTVQMLREQTRGEEILGAVMYSCSGRGPQQGGLIRQTMADANRFSKGFPQVPCLGFYAGGEIGPMALAGNQNVFRKGKAAVQGFTAVFCLFIVPVVERLHYSLDDSPCAVRKFVEKKLPV